MIHANGPQDIKVCKLRYSISITNDKPLFFNLVDYRNILFTSNDLEKIIEFYNGFDNRDQLIQWMKERPKGVSYIHEVDGDNDIIVVIPTADFNGKYAINCRENIFKGLHMIFVESGGKDDFYFNYAHNCNVGIKKAMEYNPKWVVVSNDDMYKIDEVSVLIDGLHKIDPRTINTVYTQTSFYHSRDAIISERTIIRSFIIRRLVKRGKERMELEYKYDNRYIAGTSSLFFRLLYKPVNTIKYSGSFGIFSYKLINELNHDIFDVVYINGAEDIDLCWRLKQMNTNVVFIDYKIGDIMGGTIGLYDSLRKTRDIINVCYLNSKIRSGKLSLL